MRSNAAVPRAARSLAPRGILAICLLVIACGGSSDSGAADGPTAPGTPTASGSKLSLQKFSGDGQSAPAGTVLAAAVVVHITKPDGTAAAGVRVTWNPSSNGTLAAADSLTDALGRATAAWKLRRTTTDPDTIADSLSVSAVNAGSVIFVARALPVIVASVSITGATSVVPIGTTLQLVATPMDSSGVRLTNRTVAWSTDSSFFATVNAGGILTVVGADSTRDGLTTVRAGIGGVVGSFAIRIPFPLNVSPDSMKVEVGGTAADLAVTGVQGPIFTARSSFWVNAKFPGVPPPITVSESGAVTGIAATISSSPASDLTYVADTRAVVHVSAGRYYHDVFVRVSGNGAELSGYFTRYVGTSESVYKLPPSFALVDALFIHTEGGLSECAGGGVAITGFASVMDTVSRKDVLGTVTGQSYISDATGRVSLQLAIEALSASGVPISTGLVLSACGIGATNGVLNYAVLGSAGGTPPPVLGYLIAFMPVGGP